MPLPSTSPLFLHMHTKVRDNSGETMLLNAVHQRHEAFLNAQQVSSTTRGKFNADTATANMLAATARPTASY